jgi:hypothetical protein
MAKSKPHKCQDCGRPFVSASALAMHRKAMHREGLVFHGQVATPPRQTWLIIRILKFLCGRVR